MCGGMRGNMKIKVLETDYANKRFWEERADIQDGADMMRVVNIYPERGYQEIKGFGGAFTEASGYNLKRLPEQVQEEIIQAYFGEDGLKYNLCRTHINSCDFALGNYAYVEDAADTQFQSFSIERDREYIIPMIQRAVLASGEEITMLASPWSPPAFMKTNGEMNHGGKLKQEYYLLWAKYLARYVKEYAAAGIKISMITVQNEPMAVQTWDSCIYEAEEERLFVRDYLGPVFKEEGLSEIKILIWDHNKEILFDRAKGVLEDKEASEYVSGVAFHWYSGDHFESIELVHEAYPDKELYFTEGCVEYSRFGDSSEVAKAEMYAHDILGNLLAGTNGYMDWNLLLDELGGPNHVKNYCAAPIMCDTVNGTMEKRLSYYYIGQFSRYIKKGARRVASTRFTDKVEAAAFRNPDGELAAVLLNRTAEDIWMSLRVVLEDGSEVKNSLLLKAHSICTAIWN